MIVIVMVMTILRTPHICCCHAVTTRSSVTCHVSRVTIMNIVLFRGHMPPSAQGAVLGAAKLWLLIRPHVTSAAMGGGGGWWVKQNYLKALPVISKVTYKYIEHCLQLSVFAKKCFAQCPCFETILPLVHHIYSYNISRHNAPMFMCYLVTNNEGEVSVSALL